MKINPINIFFVLVFFHFFVLNFGQEREYPDSLEAVKRAPENHIVLFENDEVRLFKVFLAAQKSEPIHTHKWTAIMWVLQPSDYEQIFYDVDEKGKYIPVQTIKMTKDQLLVNAGFPVGKGDLGMSKNLGNQDLIAYRLDFKKDFDSLKPFKKPTDWKWKENLDGEKVAPKSHQIVYEDDNLRILQVLLPAGMEEPVHVHQFPCSFWVVKSAPIEYSVFNTDKNNKLVKGKTEKLPSLPLDTLFDQTKFSDPETPHLVKNVGKENFEAYRVEYKKAFINHDLK